MEKNTGNMPSSYFLVNPEGLEEVRSLRKDLHSAAEMFDQKITELKEALPQEKKLFTLAEAAVYLSVSESFLRKYCSEGPRLNRTPGPTPIKIGDMIRYTRDDMDAWIAKHRMQRAYL
jgi:predicted DNA-binding transcriptional regulator AlpA